MYLQNYKFSPAQLAILLGLAIFLISSFALHKVTQQPWLGLTFDFSDKNPHGLLVTDVTENSPAYGKIKAGMRLMAIADSTSPDRKEELRKSIILDPLLQATLSTYKSNISHNERVSKILHKDAVILHTSDGDKFMISPKKSIPLTAVPWIIWLYLFTNYIGVVVGTIVWYRKPKKLVSILLFILGASYYLGMTASIMMTREIAINGDMLRWLATAQNFFYLSYMFSLIGILVIFPVKLSSSKYLPTLAFIFMFVWLNQAFEFADLPFHTFFLQFLIGLVAYLALGMAQWNKSKTNALNRTSCFAVLIVMGITLLLTFPLFVVPLIFGNIPIHDGLAKLSVISVFIGFAISILKYRLFEVEKWWFKTWLWLISGFLIIIFDLILVYLLHINHMTALGVAIVAVGFIYFPIRQWLFQKLLPISEKPVEDYFPTFMQSIKDGMDASGFENSWRDVLNKHYRPMNIEYKSGNETVTLFDSGLSITVPATGNNGHYCLTGKSGGIRLFNKKDCKDITALHSLIQLIDQTSQKRHELIMEEREKIMQDMHDTVGADLLTLSHRTDEPASKEHIRNTLQILRDTVRLSRGGVELLSLEKLLADWRSETVERCELADIELDWNLSHAAEKLHLTVMQAVMLQQIVRECITNAIKHAQPDTIRITVTPDQHHLIIEIENNGKFKKPERWKEGMGLTNIKSRLEKLHGSFTISTSHNFVKLTVSVPLATTSTR